MRVTKRKEKRNLKSTELIGKRFGKLVVQSISYGIKNMTICSCLCDCGNTKIYKYSELKKYQEKRPPASCGCEFANNKVRARLKSTNIIGQRYGSLEIVDFTRNAEGDLLWKCRCDCGGESVHKLQDLNKSIKKGHTPSCGCLHFKHLSETHTSNLLGQKFGRWTVISKAPDEIQDSKGAKWICKCECGEERFVRTSTLTMGRSVSCGCYRADSAREWVNTNRHKFNMRKGKDHYWYVDTLSAEDRRKGARTSIYTLKWRYAVLKRDKYSCQICGKKGPKGMDVHHLEPWSKSNEGRFLVDNGVVLCKNCHYSYHSKYPAKIATPSNFQSFKESKQTVKYIQEVKQ